LRIAADHGLAYADNAAGQVFKKPCANNAAGYFPHAAQGATPTTAEIVGIIGRLFKLALELLKLGARLISHPYDHFQGCFSTGHLARSEK
jgi:hypothetical protein